jgi:hypothetical protein
MAQGATRISPMMAGGRGVARRTEINDEVFFKGNAPIREYATQLCDIEIAKWVCDQ